MVGRRRQLTLSTYVPLAFSNDSAGSSSTGATGELECSFTVSLVVVDAAAADTSWNNHHTKQAFH